MTQTLADAPTGTPLTLEHISDTALAERLARLGVVPGAQLVRQGDSVGLAPIKVRSQGRDVILPGAMAATVVAHLDDGRKLPLADLQPGESGHVEGIATAGPVAEAFHTLGLEDNAELTLVRILPPMDYLAVVRNGGRMRLGTRQAALLWGCCSGDKATQFAMATVGQEFAVESILGEGKEYTQGQPIAVGGRLTLERVEPASQLHLETDDASGTIALQTSAGLRLYLSMLDAQQITVAF